MKKLIVSAIVAAGSIISFAPSAGAKPNCASTVPNSNLVGCQIIHVDLHGLDLHGSNLNGGRVSSSNLTDTNLSGASMVGTNFAGGIWEGDILTFVATLTRTNFNGANLSKADLTGATLSSAKLNLANLSGADLTNSSLSNGDFTGTNLTKATLTGANLSGAKLAGATLTNVISGFLTGTPASLPTGWTIVGGYLRGPGSTYKGLDFTGADLRNQNFVGANLINANFTNADLGGANLTGAKLTGANLSGTKFSETTLLEGVISGGITGTPVSLPSTYPGSCWGGLPHTQANCRLDQRRYWTLINGYLVGPQANLKNANLAGADLRAADLNDIPNLTGADLVGANVSGNDLRRANFTKADLGSANLSSTWVTGTNFSKAILTSANLASISSCEVSFVSSHWEGTGYGFDTLVTVQSMDNGTVKYFNGSMELTHLPAHPIVSQGSQEGVPDGSPLEILGMLVKSGPYRT